MGRQIEVSLHLHGRKILVVKEYKYLGVMFSASGKFNIVKEYFLQRGYKAMFKLTSMFKGAQPKFHVNMHLFDHVVKPALLYAAEV